MVKEDSISKIIYTKHAEDRIKQREITKKQVEATISAPDEVKSGKYNKQIARRKINSEAIEVVYVVENNQIVVITTYWGD